MAGRTLGYRLRPSARADLENIWLYTREHWSIEQADAYVGAIVAALEELAQGRKTPRRADIREGYFKLAVGSHVIYFTRAHFGADVVRILHQRMDVSRRL